MISLSAESQPAVVGSADTVSAASNKPIASAFIIAVILNFVAGGSLADSDVDGGSTSLSMTSHWTPAPNIVTILSYAVIILNLLVGDGYTRVAKRTSARRLEQADRQRALAVGVMLNCVAGGSQTAFVVADVSVALVMTPLWMLRPPAPLPPLFRRWY
ncbi:hypothetical protein PHYSODRAFT_325356 [Phytophthora sojae]|uniref:Uncharacterized protein n=1 Tax=Phytophthora sojae (strain P6497) TaxID=1094619 RepID=G4YSU3_PHYSP|nr:hypothetical protein PHYSODRAFT_325356 [Phytophthora sojae]EGZ24215.1 hypothetical protein PHYSODRAFT_325356 [Phytophthora sojae]|eukprot:XP_009519503.1 hypothetical protein PHYSODRAFT_325356 [Phytophthora sojae]